MDNPLASNYIILDLGCITNLYVSGQVEDILRSIPKTVTVTTSVFNQERLELQPLVDAGLLKITSMQVEAEAATCVNLAAEIDDSGAMTGAIAIQRNWSIGTDDQKARLLFQREATNLQLMYTLEIVKFWTEIVHPSFETVFEVLQNIREQAYYEPRKNHPLFSWWKEYVKDHHIN